MDKPINKKEEERFVKVRIVSHSGDKAHLKLPTEFVKKMIKNNALDFLRGADSIIDSNKLLGILVNAFDYNLLGEIAHLERSNGDVIRVRID